MASTADTGLEMALNDEQLRAATVAPDVHAIVRAGAGTGKTRTLVARAAHLLQQGVEPDRLALLTFTRRAAREMVHRVGEEVGDRATRVFAGTFHAFCLGWMRRRPQAFRAREAVVIDRDDAEQLMKLSRGHHVEEGRAFPKAGAILSWHSYARNTNLPLRRYLDRYAPHAGLAGEDGPPSRGAKASQRRFGDGDDGSGDGRGDRGGAGGGGGGGEADVVDTIVRIVDEYEGRKRECGYLDFDDLLTLLADRLEQDQALRDDVRSRYDHLLVDEMQDTNPVQWRILDALRDPPRLFCVGDEAQSIYAFRGADFENVHAFTDRVPDAVELKLEENYRSQQPVLDLANWLLGESPLDYAKELEAHRAGEERPQLHEFADPRAEAEWIADDILRRVETDDDAWSDHMILVRTMWAARTDIEPTLARRDIPYVVIGGISVFQTAHVKDLMAAIRAAFSLDDQLAWSRYLTMFYGVGDVTASRMLAALRAEPTPARARQAFVAKFADHRDILTGPRIVEEHQDDPAQAVSKLADFLDDVQARRFDNWDDRARDYDLLAELAEDHADLRDFLETYTLDPLTSKQLEERDRDDVVTLITIHSAKGTEARTCYIPKAGPGMYPHHRSIGNPDDVEEERRILYVAMTRAKDHLVLSRTAEGFAEGPYFLKDLPEDLVDRDVHGVEPDGFRRASELGRGRGGRVRGWVE